MVARQPGALRRTFLPLNFLTMPLVSVLMLLATQAIGVTELHDGILGANGVKPIDIMALFISLAYLSISLDATGLLRFLALWVVQKGGSSGRRLFTYLYFFFLLCGVIVGNDPVILSGTAFLAYLTRVSGISNPRAWVFSQFAAANMASVVLVSSNPTNLVLSGAFSLPFTTYTAHCVLPFLGAALFVYPVLRVLFRGSEYIPVSIELDLGVDSAEGRHMRDTLVDPSGAIFGSALLVATLGVLVGTSTVGVPVWEITVPPAIVMLFRDLWHDWTKRPMMSPPDSSRSSPEMSIPDATVDAGSQTHLELQERPARSTSGFGSHAAHPRALVPVVQSYLARFSSALPTVAAILQRLPYPLLPFAFLMFILVQALSAAGWVELFARWWAVWIVRTGVVGAVGGMAFLACIFCNVCGTNIGATILLARVIQLWIMNTPEDQSIDPRTRYGAIYALALGSNYGAFTLTFSASLAGLLWRRILQQKGIFIHPMHFLMLNLPISLTAMCVSSAILLAQTYVVYRAR
ncbi:hypothetical protein WOLCODRAFT_80579 [Wolfiporia cocos MD-104 SS10]|uniref:Citrate transporter-like domain-containing protein n=1 Tax=Wolfiporia cocos (strain MD-104) TaxID=742152 RepID=A0A2H3J165_WOLCO|nr:hypothetical protein WOLCODRAFT_80579 [Wolfiporia cocos MD-104 SS10]